MHKTTNIQLLYLNKQIVFYSIWYTYYINLNLLHSLYTSDLMPPSTHSQPHQASKYIASQYKSNICFVYEQILHRKKYIIIWKISKRKFDIYLNTFELAIYTKIQLASIEKQSKHGTTKTKISNYRFFFSLIFSFLFCKIFTFVTFILPTPPNDYPL